MRAFSAMEAALPGYIKKFAAVLDTLEDRVNYAAAHEPAMLFLSARLSGNLRA